VDLADDAGLVGTGHGNLFFRWNLAENRLSCRTALGAGGTSTKMWNIKRPELKPSHIPHLYPCI
jgi:hypothetical protein